MRSESPARLLLGLGTGLLFGALLQQGRATRRETIVRQLLLEDFTVVKIMGTAATVGAVGTYALTQTGHYQPSEKPLRVGGTLLGGTLFGAGMALAGYCPGTGVAAVGEGRGDALASVLGMLAGAAAFVLAYPRLEPLMTAGEVTRKTMPALTGTSPWPWIVGMGGVLALAARYLHERTHALLLAQDEVFPGGSG